MILTTIKCGDSLDTVWGGQSRKKNIDTGKYHHVPVYHISRVSVTHSFSLIANFHIKNHTES